MFQNVIGDVSQGKFSRCETKDFDCHFKKCASSGIKTRPPVLQMEGKCVCGSQTHLHLFPSGSVSTSEGVFIGPTSKEQRALQTSVQLDCHYNKVHGESVPVFCFLPVSLAATLSQACITNAHARSPSHTSPSAEGSLPTVLAQTLRATPGAPQGA